MNAESATKFVFPCGRSVKDAFTSLKNLVAARSPGEENLVTLPWVQNHWDLIVWKLACYARTRPDLLDKWWKFEMVIDQLRYR
jgi:breast cancer 2 susceptibility protein